MYAYGQQTSWPDELTNELPFVQRACRPFLPILDAEVTDGAACVLMARRSFSAIVARSGLARRVSRPTIQNHVRHYEDVFFVSKNLRSEKDDLRLVE